jgi:signal peptidase II
MTGPTVRRALRLSLVGLAALLVGCDHASKHVATAVLGVRGPVDLVPGVLDLQYAENHDTAFSLLRGITSPAKGPFLLAFTLLATVMVAVAWWRRRGASGSEQLGWALVLSGAVGNVVDRIARGYVVDFIHVAHWPVFNVADIAITVGAAWLALVAIRRRRAPDEAPG